MVDDAAMAKSARSVRQRIVSMTQLLNAYRVENLLDSYMSNTNSEAGSVVLALSAKVARKTNTK